MDFVPMFLTGLLTSVHCVAMCGTLVVTYSVGSGGPGHGLRERLAPHAAYQAAKILSYVLVGLTLGAIGAAFDLRGVRGWVTIGAGAFMVLLGLQMTGRFPALRAFALRPPRFLTSAVANVRRRARSEAATGGVRFVTPVLFGLLTGLMPCGPLQAAQLYAAGTGSPARGAVAMLGFGLGTAPLMFVFGAASSAFGEVFKRRMLVAAAVLVMILGVVMLDRGAMLAGSPVTLRSVWHSIGGGADSSGRSAVRQAVDGIAEVDLVIRDTRFVPDTVRIPAGREVRLVVDRQEDDSCSSRLAVPRLGVLADLAPFSKTSVILPPAKAGSYTLTCGMGMMSGRLVAGSGGAARVPPVYVAVVLALLVAGFAAWRLSRWGSVGVLLGFTPVEALLIVAALVLAIALGLFFGGGSSR